MRIGFDLDKVFINYPPFVPDALVNKLYKKRSNGVLLYRIPSKPEQILRRISHYPGLRPLIKDNLAFLKILDTKNNSLFLISSRFGFLEDVTTRLIKKLGFDRIFQGIYFNYTNEQPHLFKDSVLKTLDLDIYVDDDLRLLQYVAKRHPKTSFFWLNPKEIGETAMRNITAITDIRAIIQ